MNVIERAAKEKLEFSLPSANYAVGELWNVPLDELLAASLKVKQEIRSSSGSQYSLEKLKTKFEVLEHIIDTRLERIGE